MLAISPIEVPGKLPYFFNNFSKHISQILSEVKLIIKKFFFTCVNDVIFLLKNDISLGYEAVKNSNILSIF